MAELTKLDPAFEALLREVASEPESRLLRAPRGREVPRWLSLDAPASVGDLELGRAERELVRVGREELAWLFRQAALRELFEGEATRAEVIRGRAVDARCGPIVREEIAARMRAASAEVTAAGDSVQLLLRRWLGEENSARPSAASLAAASMRFVPGSQARAIAGLDYLIHRELASAEAWLLASLRSDETSERAVPTWNNLSFTYLRLGKPEVARLASMRAASIQPGSLITCTGMLISALLLEKAEWIRLAARDFGACSAEAAEPVTQLADRLRHQRACRELVIPAAASELLKQHRVRAGEAERIIDELV